MEICCGPVRCLTPCRTFACAPRGRLVINAHPFAPLLRILALAFGVPLVTSHIKVIRIPIEVNFKVLFAPAGGTDSRSPLHRPAQLAAIHFASTVVLAMAFGSGSPR